MINKKYMVIAVLSFSVLATPKLDLDYVTEVVDSVCGKTLQKGSYESSSIELDVSELTKQQKVKIAEIFKQNGMTLTLDENTELLTATKSKYTGVRQEDLAEVNSKIMSCRKKIGLDLINLQIATKE